MGNNLISFYYKVIPCNVAEIGIFNFRLHKELTLFFKIKNNNNKINSYEITTKQGIWKDWEYSNSPGNEKMLQNVKYLTKDFLMDINKIFQHNCVIINYVYVVIMTN